MIRQGREMWITFKSWFWKIDCDEHEDFIRAVIPIIPKIDLDLKRTEDERIAAERAAAREKIDAEAAARRQRYVDDFEAELHNDGLAKVVKPIRPPGYESNVVAPSLTREISLEDCLEPDFSCNAEYNEEAFVQMDARTVLYKDEVRRLDGTTVPEAELEKFYVDAVEALEGSDKDDEDTTDPRPEKRSNSPRRDVLFRMDRLKMRKQKHMIRHGFIEKAVECVEKRIRVRHGIVASNELNEQAIRMTALQICSDYNINENDTLLIATKATWKAMIPDQMQISALKMIYNDETQDRLSTVEALRASAKTSVFSLRPFC